MKVYDNFSDLYIIKCDFTPFGGYVETLIRGAYKDNYVIPLKESYVLDEINVSETRILAYKKEDLKLLEKEVNLLNKFYNNSKEGIYHFYIKKLNSGKNKFKIKPATAYTNFGSFTKGLNAYWLRYELI